MIYPCQCTWESCPGHYSRPCKNLNVILLLTVWRKSNGKPMKVCMSCMLDAVGSGKFWEFNPAKLGKEDA